MQKPPSRFLDGLLVGLILGFCLALLITTKKGRRMLKTLTEEGLDSVSELRKRLDNIEVTLDEDESDEEYIAEENAEEVETHANGLAEKIEPVEDPQKRNVKKRLFKGISRKN